MLSSFIRSLQSCSWRNPTTMLASSSTIVARRTIQCPKGTRTISYSNDSYSHNDAEFAQSAAKESSGEKDHASTWVKWEESTVRHLPRPPSTYAGRSVHIGRNGDVAGAFMHLQNVLQRNNVTKELRLAERHEKKGAKRRRLSSERWRRRFAHEVRKKVQLVNEIRARGA